MAALLETFAPLRRRRPHLDSRNVEAAYRAFGGSPDRLHIGRSGADAFYLTIRGVWVASTKVALIQSGAPTRVATDGLRDEYRILLPLRRGAEMVVGRRHIACDRRRGAVGSPGRFHLVASQPGCEDLWLSIRQAEIARLTGALLGDILAAPVVFDPEIDTAGRRGRSLVNSIAFAVRELADIDSAFHDGVLMRELEELIVTSLLLVQPHNYSERLARPQRTIAPGDVRRAVDYIHDHLQAPVSLADLVEATGVPGRTLRHHFQCQFGMPPMTYLRQARYAKARELLLADPTARVTDVATSCGFDHLGRFAAGYRQRFGEVPSQAAATLRRRR